MGSVVLGSKAVLHTPKIRVVAVADDVIIGRRVCKRGEVVSTNEVVAHAAVHRDHPIAVLAPGERFVTPPAYLNAALECADWIDVYADQLGGP